MVTQTTAQLNVRHYWTVATDSVTTTVHDSTWTSISDQWYSMTCWFTGGAGSIRFISGADTTTIGSMSWIPLSEYQQVEFGASPPITRLQFKSNSVADTLTFYQVGLRRRSQF